MGLECSSVLFRSERTEVHDDGQEISYNVTENFKGTMESFKKTFPKRVNWQKDKEYLVFMRKATNGYLQLCGYEGAVICESDESFDEALELVKKGTDYVSSEK